MPTTSPRQWLTWLLSTLGALAALCAFLLGTASPAAAHAALTGSSPAAGSVVGSAPGEVTLTFSENIATSDDSIRVLAPDGKRVDTGGLKDLSEGGAVKHGTQLRSDLADGTYTVAWKAVSADSHPIGGAFTFSIGAPSETSVGAQDTEAGGGTTGYLYDLARYAAYGGFVVLVGGAAFVLACWREGAKNEALQRLVSGAWVVMAAATVAMLALRGPYTGSGSLTDAFDLAVLKETLDTKSGTALMSRLLLLAAAAAFLSVLFGTYAKDGKDQKEDGKEGTDSKGGKQGKGGKQATDAKAPLRTPAERRDLLFGLSLGGTVVAAGLAATWAMSEHASTGIQTMLAMPVAVVHLLAVACWLGGLTSLLTALHRGTPPSVAATRRFSQLAFTSVIVLVGTGLYQSWRQVGSWSALTGTDYGVLLLLKLGLISLLLGIAWFSRRWTARLVGSATAGGSGVSGAEGRGEEEPGGVGGAAEGEDREDTDTDTDTDSEAEPVLVSAGGPDRDPDPDPVRAAQLARQRAATATARRKRARDSDLPRAGLRRSVLYEAGVAVAILAVATLLSGTEPGRAVESEQGSGATSAAPAGPVTVDLPFDTGGPNGKGTAKITLNPGTKGNNGLTIKATDPDGKPVKAPEVQVALTQPAKDIGPLRTTPNPAGEGRWVDTEVRLPVSGNWRIALTIRTSDIDQVTETKTVRIG
ncbi:copper resistance protein CopC [Streptomyces sp. N2-109]|uniref:Copper resistance protein CopC n=1 Tax=Streptomyces gossypii TaxID=2883101 RepID=A0ABT2JN75_9ACTN|nr:copper resistance protein CopC [Streptomyces gossypii]